MKLNVERQKAIAKTGWAVTTGVALAVGLIFSAWPWHLLMLDVARTGWSIAVLDRWWVTIAQGYLPASTDLGRTFAWAEGLYDNGRLWLQGGTGLPPLQIPAIPIGVAVAFGLWRVMVDPSDYRRTSHGKARKATLGDLRRKQLLAKTGFILGNFRGRWVRNWETLSAILLAPPGTGKTVQLIANILADWPDKVRQWNQVAQAGIVLGVGVCGVWFFWRAHAGLNAVLVAGLAAAAAVMVFRGWYGAAAVPGPSMIINDVKGEIRDTTRGHRSQLGPSFELAWMDSSGDCFNMLDVDNFPGGDRLLATRRRLVARLDRIYGEFRLPEKPSAENPEGERGGFYSAAERAMPGLLRHKRDCGDRWWDLLLENPEVVNAPLAVPPDPVHPEPGEEAGEDAFTRWCLLEGVRWHGSDDKDTGRIDEDHRKAWIRLELEKWAAIKLDGKTLVEDLLEYQNLVSNLQGVIDRQMAIWVTDTVETHWRNTGRAAGTGLTLFHIEQSLRLNRPPSYGGLLDWLTQVTTGTGGFRSMKVSTQEVLGDKGTLEYQTVVQEMGFKTAPGTAPADTEAADVNTDKLTVLLNDAIAEAREYGYSDRVLSELGDLLNKPDKERGSVVSTFGSAIAIFKNPNVRERTSRSSFKVRDLRGWGPNKRPMTVYIVIRMEDAVAVGPITAAFVDMVANTFLSQPSKEVKKGRPIQFYLDEFWTLPPMKSTMTIVTLGRGQWLQEYLVGQSASQLGMQMTGPGGQAVVDVMQDAMAYTIAPTQGSVKTAKQLEESIGNATVENVNEPVGPQWFRGLPGLFNHNKTRSWVGMPLYTAQDILNFPKLDPKKKEKGKQLVLIYGMKALPIECEPPAWFTNSIMLQRSKRSVKSVQEWMQEITPLPVPSNSSQEAAKPSIFLRRRGKSAG